MLVLALEFSRGVTARAHPTTALRVFGHARGERPAAAEQAARRHRREDSQMAAPSKRKSEVRCRTAGAGSVSGGLSVPEGTWRRSGIRRLTGETK